MARRRRKGPPLRLRKIEILLAEIDGDRIVIRVSPSGARDYIDAPPCPHCGGRGLLENDDRCNPCEATGLAATFVRENEAPA